MPQSLSNLLTHVVFSTKKREPLLTSEVRQELNAYLVGVLRNQNCPMLQVGSVEDHVHVLTNVSRTLSVAQLVQELKTDSSKCMKERWDHCGEFSWQRGYGAFSVGAREANAVVQYIKNQEEHNRHASFQDEYPELLKAAGIEYDERFVWD